MPPGARTRLIWLVELRRGERARGQCTGKDVADDEVAGVRRQRLGDLPGLPHAEPQQRGLGEVEPAPDILGQLAVELHHHLPRVRVGGMEVAGQGTCPAAQVQPAEAVRFGLLGPALSGHHRPARFDQRRHPAHVLKIEEERIGEVDVRTHNAVDPQEPAGGVVLVRDELAVAGIDVVDALDGAVLPGSFGHLDDPRRRTLAVPAA